LAVLKFIRGEAAMEKQMLLLTKMDTRKILINTRCIQTIESSPDTVIILSGGRKLIVKESLEEIVQMIQEG
jgi:flagellar protein FlbD